MNEKLITLFTEPCNRIRADMKMSPSMDEWVGELNQILSQKASRIHIVEWFGNTDNLVLRTPESNLRDVAAAFEMCTKIKCTALSLSELYFLIQEVSLTPIKQNMPCLDLKLGVGFQMTGVRRYFDDIQIGSFL